MKKTAALIIIFAILACALCACTKKGDLMVTNSDGTYTDASTGVTYTPLPSCYEPVKVGTEYKAIKVGSMEIMLYEVDGVSADKLLSTEDGNLFAGDGYEVEDIRSATVKRIGIHRGDSKNSYKNIEKAEDIAEVMGNYIDGDRVDYSQMLVTPSETRTLKFSTEENPGVYYAVTYIEYSEDVLFYDVMDSMTVKADSQVDLDAEERIDRELAERLSSGEFDKYDTENIKIEKFVYADDDKYVKDDEGMYYYNSNKKEFVHAKDVSEIPPTTQRYTLTEYNVEWSVSYNLGKYFMYNKYANICAPAGELIHSLVSGGDAK